MHKQDFLLGLGGSATIVSSQYFLQSNPNLLITSTNMSQGLSYQCTGSCGACGGGCLITLGAVLFLGSSAYFKQKAQIKKHSNNLSK